MKFVIRVRLDNDGRIEAYRVRHARDSMMNSFYPQDAIRNMEPDKLMKAEELRTLWRALKTGVKFYQDTGEFTTGENVSGYMFAYQATRGRPDLFMPITFENYDEEFMIMLLEESVRLILEKLLHDFL